MNSNPRSVILSARGNGLVLLNSYPAMTYFSFFPANFSKPDRKTDTSTEHGDLFYGYKVLPDLLPMWQNWEILWNKIIMSSAHQIADNLKITRVFISLFSWIMLPSLHNIFPDQVKKSDTLFLLLSYSSTPRLTVLHQEADKLYPAQISSCCILSHTYYMSQYPVL